MVQHGQTFSITQLNKLRVEQLVELNKLRQHEEANPMHLKELKES